MWINYIASFYSFIVHVYSNSQNLYILAKKYQFLIQRNFSTLYIKYQHQWAVYSFYEVSKIMGQTYAVQWLPQIIQEKVNDSTTANSVSY
jgi:hypothetical protein